MIPRITPLSLEIGSEHSRLIEVVRPLSLPDRQLKKIEGTGGVVSVADILAYQIGWGKSLIRWYVAGLKGEMPEMPGDGFSKWDYTKIALHFYQKYAYDSFLEQENILQETVNEIVSFVDKEHQTGNLYKTGVWAWCSLSSGKMWPLIKWVKVNTSSPYKRAYLSIKKGFR